jgi:uncharacterized damage-inducible protein DinB
MEETRRIAEQLKRAHEGFAWHGPSLKEILADVDAEKAAAHPLPGAHSIWELLMHIRTWDLMVLKRLSGRPPAPTPKENFPVITDTSETAWSNALKAAEDAYRELHSAILFLSDARLEEELKEGVTIYDNLHGAVQHDLYHAGQMAMLKKMGT